MRANENYFRHVDNETYRAISELLQSKKILETEVDKEEMEGDAKNMCNLSDLIVERTERKVTAKETVQSVKNLMENLQWSLEKACEAFGKTVEDFQAAKQVLDSIQKYSIDEITRQRLCN